jgi:hypothetical protein
MMGVAFLPGTIRLDNIDLCVHPAGASEYASQSLVGDQITPPTGSSSFVTNIGHPP